MFPVECVARGYLSGSGWKEYKATGNGLRHQASGGTEGIRPTARTDLHSRDQGHHGARRQHFIRRNVQAGRSRIEPPACATSPCAFTKRPRITRGNAASSLPTPSLNLDRPPKGITLADEVLTPDSSRFWPADTYQPGKAQDSYDKQYVRDYLEEIRWNKQPPAPALPQDVALRTSEKYLGAYRQLTGRELET
jgi:phosphoribosylaminoimidazole-succinocarboxamide synthase